MLKLFLESVFWNWISTGTGIACVLLYYATVLLLNSEAVAQLVEPELQGEYNKIFMSPKAWICMIILPLVALLPDVTYQLMQKTFWPTPTDAIMLRQQREPNYVYDGFDEVYIP